MTGLLTGLHRYDHGSLAKPKETKPLETRRLERLERAQKMLEITEGKGMVPTGRGAVRRFRPYGVQSDQGVKGCL